MAITSFTSIKENAPWMIQYFIDGEKEAEKYSCSSNKKINMKCPYCNKIFDKKITINNLYRRKRLACSCNPYTYSLAERILNNILIDLNESFKKEYRPEWANGKKYDFLLINKNILIELDGELGHGHRTFGEYNEEKIKKSLEIDNEKDLLAKENGFNIIRIDVTYTKYEQILEKIINSKLKEFFNFNNIDLDDIFIRSLNNNVKQICEFYEQNKNNMLKKEMYEKLHISKNTFKNYLKIGDKYGWCVYEPNKNKGNHNKISIFVDNGEKRIIYKSISDASKNLEKDFGIYCPQGNCLNFAIKNSDGKYKGLNLGFI